MAYANLYRRDRLFLPQQKLLRFAQEVRTPFFLYDEDGIRKTARLIQASFAWQEGHRSYFPLSANRCPALLRIYREEGCGALARSLPELDLAQKCGFTDILFHTAAMTAQAAELATQSGCGVIFDAPGQIEAFSAMPRRCLLRYHPEKELRHSFVSAYAQRGKSGMNREQILEAAKRLFSLGVQEIGLHCHLSGNAQTEGYYPACVSLLLHLAEELRQSGIPVNCIDPGGGIGVSTGSGSPLVHMGAVGTLAREEYARFEGTAPALFTEFGRYAIARHGVLISRVVELRERSRAYAILDVSASQISGQPFHAAQRISVVGNCVKSGRKVYSVHGCTPDAQELLCDRAVLPPLRAGTLVALRDCGAYCQSTQFARCMLPPCEAYLFTKEGEIVPLSEHQ